MASQNSFEPTKLSVLPGSWKTKGHQKIKIKKELILGKDCLKQRKPPEDHPVWAPGLAPYILIRRSITSCLVLPPKIVSGGQTNTEGFLKQTNKANARKQTNPNKQTNELKGTGGGIPGKRSQLLAPSLCGKRLAVVGVWRFFCSGPRPGGSKVTFDGSVEFAQKPE